MKKLLIYAALIFLLAACSQEGTPDTTELNAQAGSWQKLGGALDYTVEKSAVGAKLVLDRSGNLVVAWIENNNGLKIYLERWTGTGWQSFGPGVPIKVGLFNIAFDRTNSPVIITPSSSDNGSIDGCGGDGFVLRRDSKSGVWTTIRNLPFAARGITADKNGYVYIVTQGFNTNTSTIFHRILRWDGQAWQNFGTFLPRNSEGEPYIGGVCNISLDNIGRLVLTGIGNPFPELYYSFHTYNGTAWQYTAGYISEWSIFNPVAFDKQNKIVTSQGSGGGQILRGTQTLGNPFISTTITGIAVDSANRPLLVSAAYDGEDEGDVLVKRWTGSAWVNLGGVVDRLPSRFAATFTSNNGPLLVDSQGTIYIAWQECVGISSDFDCTNWNVYVSKYVP